MRFNTPNPSVRDGEFAVRTNPASDGSHFALVEMGEGDHAWQVGLTLHSVSDCERIMRAAVTAKRMLETIRAGTPHQFTPGAEYGSNCVTCGLLWDAKAHVRHEQPDADGPATPHSGHPGPPTSAAADPAVAA